MVMPWHSWHFADHVFLKTREFLDGTHGTDLTTVFLIRDSSMSYRV
jgi:hypothetical protein